jgi:hypothetical protein
VIKQRVYLCAKKKENQIHIVHNCWLLSFPTKKGIYFIDLLIVHYHRELLELVLKYLLMDLLQHELVLLEEIKSMCPVF